MTDCPTILVCPGNSPAAKLTRHAAQELVLAGRAIWLTAGSNWLQQAAANRQTIIIDACEKRCLSRHMHMENDQPKHYLCLTDLGIEQALLDNSFKDDLILIKDAVAAECTEVSQMPLFFMQKCSCR